MSKLEIDFNNINNDFIKKIDNGIIGLTQVIDNIEKIDKPISFSYSTYLKNLPNELKKIKFDCIDIKEHIIKCSDSYLITADKIKNLFETKKDQ